MGEGSLLAPDISLFPTLRYLHSDFAKPFFLLFFSFFFFFTISFYRSARVCCMRVCTPWLAITRGGKEQYRFVSSCAISRYTPLRNPVVCDLHSLGLSDRKPGIRAALNQRYTIIQPFRKLALLILLPSLLLHLDSLRIYLFRSPGLLVPSFPLCPLSFFSKQNATQPNDCSTIEFAPMNRNVEISRYE